MFTDLNDLFFFASVVDHQGSPPPGAPWAFPNPNSAAAWRCWRNGWGCG